MWVLTPTLSVCHQRRKTLQYVNQSLAMRDKVEQKRVTHFALYFEKEKLIPVLIKKEHLRIVLGKTWKRHEEPGLVMILVGYLYFPGLVWSDITHWLSLLLAGLQVSCVAWTVPSLVQTRMEHSHWPRSIEILCSNWWSLTIYVDVKVYAITTHTSGQINSSAHWNKRI